MLTRKKKLRCQNCGTVIKDGEKSCSVCHMVAERPKEEEEVQEETEVVEFTLKEQFSSSKIVMIIIIFVGIVLTIKGVVEFQNVSYCTADDCGLKPLFVAGLGIILIFSASVSLAKEGKIYKVK